MCSGQHGPVLGAAAPADIQIAAHQALTVDFGLFAIKAAFNLAGG